MNRIKVDFDNENVDFKITLSDRDFFYFSTIDKSLSLDNKIQKEILSELENFFPLFHNQVLDSLTPNLLIKKINLKEVTFFGGTFNPFHEGHMECLRQCPDQNVVVMPDLSPFKAIDEKRNVLYEFKDLAIKLKDTTYSIYPGFWAQEMSNPTSSWINKLNIEKKNLLMGDDSFTSLPKWNNSEFLLNNLNKIFVVPRADEKLHETINFIKMINPKLEIHILNKHLFMNVSSTKIRNK